MKEFEIFKLEDRVLFEAAAAAEIVAAADAAAQVREPEPEPQDSLAAALNGGPAGSAFAGTEPAAQPTPAGIDGELDALISSIAPISARTMGLQSSGATEISVTTYGDLKEALEDAAANGGNYEITIENDITITGNLNIYAGNDLNLTIQGAENIQDANGVADLNAGGSFIFFHFDDSLDEYTVNITVSNLNFNGQETAKTAILTYGVEHVEISDSRFESFTESAILQEGGQLTVTDSEFIGNKSLNNSGSAIRALDAEVSISGSYFAGNESEVDDGVLWIENAPSLTITDTTFANNNGTAAHLTGNTAVSVENSTFYDNTGGALHLFGNQQVDITNSTFAAKTADADGSAIYNNGGTVAIRNTLLIGNDADSSVIFQDVTGSTALDHSLATSVSGEVTVTGAPADWVNSNYVFANVFGQNDYSETTRTIAPDAFHKAAWSGKLVGSSKDQLGNDRNIINTTTGLSGLYTIGAVNAQVGLIVTQGDAEVYYTGSPITPEADLVLTYANGDVVNKSVTADLSPSSVQEIGEYTITPENAVVTGVDNAQIRYTSGTLTVKAWDTLAIQETVFNSTYGDTLSLANSYTITTTDRLTGSEITLTVNVEWSVETSAVTYSATGHINANNYADSLQVSTYSLKDANGTDMTDFFAWDTSAKSDLEIGKKEVTVTLNDLADKGYNGAADDAVFNGGSVAGAVDGETLNVTAGAGIYNSKNVLEASYAEFAVTLAAGANADLNNYYLQSSQASAAGRITPAKLTVSIDGSQFVKVYDGTTATETADQNYTIHLFGTDQVEVTGDYAYDTKNAGPNKTVTFSNLALTGADSSNYGLTADSVSADGAEITKLTLDLDVDLPTSKVYDGTTAVDSPVTAGNILGNDQITIDAVWNYNSADVADANVITNTTWEIQGADAGNYQLPHVTPYDNLDASISALEVETVFQTNDPYFYNGTDQSNTVSAYYTDINGNRVDLAINWNGQEFKAPGSYTITVDAGNPNYALNPSTMVVTMNPAKPSYHVYCEGLYPGHFSTVINMQTELLLQSFGQAGYGNFYTMNYPELVYHTMEVRNTVLDTAAGDMACKVTVDPLKYCPITLEEPALELSESLTRNSSLTHTSALYTGTELFAESEDDVLVQLFQERGDTLSPDHEPIVIEAADDDSMDLCLVDDKHGQKVSNLKGTVERLLDELCQA